ncbi:MAG: Gfo/Idh/MocA family oxidoreductase [Verrucomicrobiota bacterium]|nr:Gfo/Idh/MocA family oxidoreductase [Verrucomicrobiota bacterium]
MNTSTCRWGILSSASIAHKNYQAIFHSGNGRVVAVASRDQKKAQHFIDACQLQSPFAPKPRALEGYEALIADPEVDALYIPLPTGLRKEWVLKAARAGKHVMCEKPCGISTADLEEMIRVCEENQVQFMDGVMFMHSQRLAAIRSVLDDGVSVGELKRITSMFSFCAPEAFLKENIRMHSGLEPVGCLGDLGWYTIRFSLWAMHYAMPIKVSGRILSGAGRKDSSEEVPMEFSGELFFEGGVSAAFYNSFLTENQQFVSLSGQKGQLTMNDFVLPYFDAELGFEVAKARFEINGSQFNMERHSTRHGVDEYSNNHPNAQETLLFKTFADLVLSGKTDSDWPEIALKTQRVMEACFKSAHNHGIMVEP